MNAVCDMIFSAGLNHCFPDKPQLPLNNSHGNNVYSGRALTGMFQSMQPWSEGNKPFFGCRLGS